MCDCTEARACPGGCSWADDEQTVCSVCSGTDGDMAYVLAWVQQIFRRPMVYATRRTLILHISRESAARYTARAAQESR